MTPTTAPTPTPSLVKTSLKPTFCSNVAQKGKQPCSRLIEPQNVAPNSILCSKVGEHNWDRPTSVHLIWDSPWGIWEPLWGIWDSPWGIWESPVGYMGFSLGYMGVPPGVYGIPPGVSRRHYSEIRNALVSKQKILLSRKTVYRHKFKLHYA